MAYKGNVEEGADIAMAEMSSRVWLEAVCDVVLITSHYRCGLAIVFDHPGQSFGTRRPLFSRNQCKEERSAYTGKRAEVPVTT
ncbi:hypothetical protein IG631_22462 [Alternaria alternata]|jgi:hypothetical protein|nr:hypothetical protein IG631_22462 [Alternaria alternata]